MIIHLTKSATPAEKQEIFNRIKQAGLTYEVSHGATGIDLVGVLGDATGIEESRFLELDGVDKVIRISRPYKLVSREFSPASKIIDIGGVKVGGGDVVIMAGPCALENEKQIMTIAQYVHALGIPVMRGGAYKPRTSPYSFQGMGLEGIKLLAKAREKYGFENNHRGHRTSSPYPGRRQP